MKFSDPIKKNDKGKTRERRRKRKRTHSIPNKNLDSDISSAVIRSNQKQTSKDDNSIENDISSLLALQGYESDEE